MDKEKQQSPYGSVEEAQENFKNELKQHLRTKTQQDKYNVISCVVVVTNEITGRNDIVASNCGNGLMRTVKAYLQAALDMLSRQQMLTALFAQQIKNKEGRNASTD